MSPENMTSDETVTVNLTLTLRSYALLSAASKFRRGATAGRSAGHTEVKVSPGQNATLQCSSPRAAEISLLEWIRPELKPGYVFFYRNGNPYENYHHESFKGRVELRDPSMKDGDVSVIVRNVSIRDTGTYECLIRTNNKEGNHEFNCSIILTVTASGTFF